ncbi:tetratricopeptide repeat protein [Amycolatopsis jejuensis]|uniref:tetratricopeptide repeat protein n=1 Tax=Amycolatopsis jejuensis TaxID=330084 RepID=UPI0005271F2C|nr:tetratricopeptide repeat protein [Amycolatopsis jejuensis]
MLKCAHLTSAAEVVRNAAAQGRFAEALEAGAEFLTAHRPGMMCRSVFAADLVELSVILGQDQLTNALLMVAAADDDVQYLPYRVRTHGMLAVILTEVRTGDEDDVRADLRGVPGVPPRPLDFRLRRSEVEVRAGLTPRQAPRPGVRLRTHRARSAAAGLGLALIEKDDAETGRRWLTAVAEQAERAGGRPDGLTRTIAGAFDAWAWARAVSGLAQLGPDSAWLAERVPVAARFFAVAGHPRWAATTDAAVRHPETRFFELGAAAAREWRTVSPEYDWLGSPPDDAQFSHSAARIRPLFLVGDDTLRASYVGMLGEAAERLDKHGAGGPLIDQLVGLLREDFAAGYPPNLLARALVLRARHRHHAGSPRAALADDVEARALLLAENTGEVTRNVERRIDDLVEHGWWDEAVRTATTFGSSAIDRVEHEAQLHNQAGVVEQLAAFRAELTRDARTLTSWAIARERLSPGSGTPVFLDAIAMAPDLAGVVETRLAAARYRPDPDLSKLLEQVLSGEFDHPRLLAELTHAVARDTAVDPATAVDLLVRAGKHLVVTGLRNGAGWVTDQVLLWERAVRFLHQPAAALQLCEALTQLPGQPDFLAAAVQMRLASTLAEAGRRAVPAARLAVQMDPESAQARRVLGRTLLEGRELPEAIRVLDEALQQEPDNAYAHFLRAEALRKSGDPDGAVAALSHALRLDPAYETATIQYSRLLRSSDSERSLAVLEALGAVHSGSSWLRYQYGLSLAATGRRPEATEFFRDALDLGGEPIRTAGPHRRAGDPNLPLFHLALVGTDPVAALARDLGPGTPDWLVQDVVDDYEEIAVVLPETRLAAGEAVVFLNGLRTR